MVARTQLGGLRFWDSRFWSLNFWGQAFVCATMMLVCLAHAAGEARADENASRVAKVLDTVVIPAFERLEASAIKLSPAVSAWCASLQEASSQIDAKDKSKAKLKTQTAKAHDALRVAYRDTVTAWGRVEFLRFGPLSAKGRRERFAFWPDPRGVVARQLRQVLAAKNPDLLVPGALAKQSAALQGLPALALLIAPAEKKAKSAKVADDDRGAYSCQFAGAVADNLAVLAREIREGWTGDNSYRAVMLGPGPDNKIYKSNAESAADLVRALLTGLQVVSETQVRPRPAVAAGETAPKTTKQRKPIRPFEPMNGYSAYYVGSIEGLKALYDGLDLDANLAPDKRWMEGWASGAWRAILASDGVGGTIKRKGASALAAPAPREISARINGLRQLLGREMANASGIPIGFNELDGD